MTAIEAAKTMTLAEYRLWWYSEQGIKPPDSNERLTFRQVADERLIRQGYQKRRELRPCPN